MKKVFFIITALIIFAAFPSCASDEEPLARAKEIMNYSSKTDTATFGAGCFWCVEAVFQRLDGVVKVVSGYSGGETKNPTYEQVCTGKTGHAEVCQIIYNPAKISFTDLLEVFFTTHDPTTLNRQGADVGTQYRSAVFYHDGRQKELEEAYKAELENKKIFSSPVVTEITPFSVFYPAEKYHQDYFDNNQFQPYCSFVLRPKLDKFTKEFKAKLKPELK